MMGSVTTDNGNSNAEDKTFNNISNHFVGLSCKTNNEMIVRLPSKLSMKLLHSCETRMMSEWKHLNTRYMVFNASLYTVILNLKSKIFYVKKGKIIL